MSTGSATALAPQDESAKSNVAGMVSFLIDPAGASRRVFTKWFWLGPLLVALVVGIVGNRMVTPIVLHVMQTQPPPPNVDAEAYRTQVAGVMKFQGMVAIVAPILILLLQSVVLWGMSSMLAVEAKFRQILNLAAGCSLISSLAAVAAIIILKAKGEIETMAELRPPMGLDIFLPETTSKTLLAAVGYFSIFEIWWIVMMVLTFSAAYRTSKGKALMAVAPLVLISFAFRVVAASFQRQ